MWRAERPEGHSTIATESHIKSAESQGCDVGRYWHASGTVDTVDTVVLILLIATWVTF
jgi:hypothetical protein